MLDCFSSDSLLVQWQPCLESLSVRGWRWSTSRGFTRWAVTRPIRLWLNNSQWPPWLLRDWWAWAGDRVLEFYLKPSSHNPIEQLALLQDLEPSLEGLPDLLNSLIRLLRTNLGQASLNVLDRCGSGQSECFLLQGLLRSEVIPILVLHSVFRGLPPPHRVLPVPWCGRCVLFGEHFYQTELLWAWFLLPEFWEFVQSFFFLRSDQFQAKLSIWVITSQLFGRESDSIITARWAELFFKIHLRNKI